MYKVPIGFGLKMPVCKNYVGIKINITDPTNGTNTVHHLYATLYIFFVIIASLTLIFPQHYIQDCC